MFTRREALQIATATGVSFLWPGLSPRAAERRGPERGKSLITLWMAGGPSQMDSWDPHPESGNAGGITALRTSAPGIEIAQHYPQMAEQMRNLSVIRSLVSKEGDHERGTYYLLTGYRPDPTVQHPSVGAILTEEQPAPGVEIPQHIVLATGEGFVVPRGGYLGDRYDAFRVSNPGDNLQNMEQRVPAARQARRLESLDVLSRSFAAGRKRQVEGTMHGHVIDEALAMMKSPQLRAFDLKTEPAELRAAYGENGFGRGCLIARKLVEEGVRSIQVVLHGFDTHADNFDGQKTQAVILDPAFATLVNDLKQRDLFDSTIVLCIGEFGRTPWINPLGGRDHWPSGFSCVVGGGGLRSGVLIGRTNPDVRDDDAGKLAKIPADPIEVPDLYATILRQMGVDGSKEIITPIGRPLALCQGKPIDRLLPG
ncbi:DUF1501 domain-containing protein [Planctomyces sp. SH-PL14]|uniref:DUF1501 domain-containing protein n=1 Tax=Planctomyces sp. SH-PL14 TaxID=1632864 RepID=UPI00078EDBD1|nr:DUF1501 domain-containing protein [Planctomyces sp. SH-PL14]AMV17579.1 hypothetical protein VT03_06780 [Planctomyces sp. SH-PL14]